jgi:hypothetical protein
MRVFLAPSTALVLIASPGQLLRSPATGAGLHAESLLPPNVRMLGRVTTQYEDKRLHSIAAYDYSQRYHDSRWLLVNLAIRTADRLTIDRSAFKLMTPAEREIVLASQERYIEDAKQIRSLVQNARSGSAASSRTSPTNRAAASDSSPSPVKERW